MAKMDADGIALKLAEPLAPVDLLWEVDPREGGPAPNEAKPVRVGCIAIPSHQAVVNRLNAVLGVWGWKDEYVILPTGEHLCTLSILVGNNWIHRSDAGNLPAKSAAGTTHRPAVNSALVTTALKFGVGEYLLRLPRMFADAEPGTRKLKTVPQLPAWAIPDDWQPAGEGMARQLLGLIERAALESAQPVEVVRARIFQAHGYTPGFNHEMLAKFHARKMMQDITDWLTDLAKKPKPTPPNPNPPPTSPVPAHPAQGGQHGGVAPARGREVGDTNYDRRQ